MTTVFDDYATGQTNNSTIGFGSYLPPGSRTISSSVGASMNVSLGLLNVSLPASGLPTQIRYLYSANQNFTTLASISLNILAVTTTPIAVTFTLTDFFTVSGSVLINVNSTGTISFDPNSIVGPALNQIRSLTIEFKSTSGLASSVTADNLASTLICLGRGTKILMADFTEKEIQDIERGDDVLGDPFTGIIHKVALLKKQDVDPEVYVNAAIIDKESLGKNIPHTPLVATENHPIVYRGARRPVKSLRNIPGVHFYKRGEENKKARDIFPLESDGTCILYDLQFDHDGTYVANGVVVQSRSPYSDLTPLPRELYFEPEKYWRDGRTNWDSIDQSIPLLLDILEK